jgi:hypothetical protein
VSSVRSGAFPSVLSLPKPTALLASSPSTAAPQLGHSLPRTPEPHRRRAPPAAGPALRGQLISGHPEPPQDHTQVAQDFLLLPTPFPLLPEPPLHRIGAQTELAPAIHGRGTQLQSPKSFRGPI